METSLEEDLERLNLLWIKVSGEATIPWIVRGVFIVEEIIWMGPIDLDRIAGDDLLLVSPS